MTTKQSKAPFKILNYSDLAAEIKSGLIRPIYLLTGDEEYLIDRISLGIRKRVLSDNAGEADFYMSDRQGGGIDAEELRSLVYTPPFISSRRVTVLRNTGLFSGRYPETVELQKSYIRLFEGIPDFACLIFIESKIDKRKKLLLEALSLRGAIAEIGRQSDRELEAWICGLLKREKIRITNEAVNSLVDRTEKQMNALEQETNKLILYCKANDISEIGMETIDLVCMPDIRGSVFKMMDSIGMRRTEDALLIFDRLISLREPVPKIRFLLSRHVRHLICAKELGRADAVSEKLKVMPFVARNLLSQSGLFVMPELIDLYHRCHESDAMVKSGRMEERQSLEWILFSIGRSDH
ncbi:MAG: DNA polymerase III subunit delta [Oscillospiraceae bacterium]|nr:DNA polymerase III subunit delta [Oscillospiraceae bacterium]